MHDDYIRIRLGGTTNDRRITIRSRGRLIRATERLDYEVKAGMDAALAGAPARVIMRQLGLQRQAAGKRAAITLRTWVPKGARGPN